MKRTKPTPDKTFQTKDPLTKSPDKNPREQLRENLYKGLLSEFFYTMRRGSRGKLAGKSVFLQIIGNDNANLSVFSPQHTY